MIIQAYNNLTIIYLELNHIDEALKTCNKSIEINPTNIEAYNFAGLIYQRKNEINKSLDNFKQALKIKPNFFPSLLILQKFIKN